MAKKKAKKSFVSPTQLLADSLEVMALDGTKKAHLDTLMSAIEDEVRKQLIEFSSSIDEEITRIRSHFLDLKLMIPSKVRELTVGEIVAAGGSFQLQDNDDNNLVVNVPTEMFEDPAFADSLASSLMIINSAKKSSRPVLNDATNSVRRTGLRSTMKRSRIPTGMTPSSSKRGKNTSMSGNMSSCVPSTGRVTRSTARKGVPSKPHTKPPTNGSNDTYATPKGVKNPGDGAVFRNPGDGATFKNPGDGATFQFAVVNNVTINNIAPKQNDGDRHLVNPKTPGGNNLFRKLPRIPDPGEDMNIVVYSNQGTPLVVDPVQVIASRQKYGKSITNK